MQATKWPLREQRLLWHFNWTTLHDSDSLYSSAFQQIISFTEESESDPSNDFIYIQTYIYPNTH